MPQTYAPLQAMLMPVPVLGPPAQWLHPYGAAAGKASGFPALGSVLCNGRSGEVLIPTGTRVGGEALQTLDPQLLHATYFVTCIPVRSTQSTGWSRNERWADH